MIRRRLRGHLRRHSVDGAYVAVGMVAVAVAALAGPLVIAVPAASVAITAALVLILRNSAGGEDR